MVSLFKGRMYYCDLLHIDEIFHKEIKTMINCLDNGGDWVNYDLNYDNIWRALNSMFMISTVDGWTNLM